MDEKILTLHPDKEKKGVKISKAKYDVMREAIFQTMGSSSETTFSELNQEVKNSCREHLKVQ